jgi:hypothetical protein
MAVPQPLFTDALLAAVPMTLPVGVAAPLNPTHMVRLTLSTGDVVSFGTVQNLMRLVTRMVRDGQHTVCPQEDVFVALAGASKLVIGEQTFQNQKLQNAGSFVYTQGRLMVKMRGGACVEDLDGALACVGHFRPTAAPYQSTADLLVPQGIASPRLIVVDYKYNEDGTGTTFVDAPPLQEQSPL